MSPRSRRKKSGFEKKGAAEWLVTYSDMITLCLTFFVLLYSFSNLDKQKWEATMISIQQALGPAHGGMLEDSNGILDGQPPKASAGESDTNTDTGTEIAAENLLKYQIEMESLAEAEERLKSYLEENGLETSIFVTSEERGLVLRFQDSVLFEKGKADLLPHSQQLLTGVSGILQELPNPIRIEGHTDNLPINTVQFPSNWELSAARATNVLRYLIGEGLDGKQLSAVGYGEYHPLSSNDNEENRRKNRRVDIVIIRKSLWLNEPK